MAYGNILFDDYFWAVSAQNQSSNLHLGGLGGTITIPNSVAGKLPKPSMVINF
jgi:hypothetical protein